ETGLTEGLAGRFQHARPGRVDAARHQRSRSLNVTAPAEQACNGIDIDRTCGAERYLRRAIGRFAEQNREFGTLDAARVIDNALEILGSGAELLHHTSI